MYKNDIHVIVTLIQQHHKIGTVGDHLTPQLPAPQCNMTRGGLAQASVFSVGNMKIWEVH